jgi:hypothetical protein
MKRILRYRPSPSTAIALLALFIAVGGTATAATLISGRQVRDNSLTTKDVRNRSLLAHDFRRGQLRRGRTGPRGSVGPQGPPGVDQLVYPVSAAKPIASNGTASVAVSCPTGTFPTGGDVFALTPEPQSIVPNAVTDQGLAFTSGRPSGWSGTVHNNTGQTINAFAEAICANVNNPIIPQSSRRSGPHPRSTDNR